MPQLTEGTIFGAWTIQEFLGHGGNAEVWTARASDDKTVALKVLKSRRVDSEPYARFRQEIMALQQIGHQRGILPILDYDLPEAPARRQRAWLAMPVAEPLADALQEQSLPNIVGAIANIAKTLDVLKREHGIHHRDIKPANLYIWEGYPTISDFGLVDIPKGLDLTPKGRPLGPALFLPYEMLTDPANADPGPADVYSLAKTLWVLATDQRWPPQGEQSSVNTAISVNEFRPHPLAHQVDGLIERCTAHQPEHRPTMGEFAIDLRSWLELDGQTSAKAVDTSGLWKGIREAAAPVLTEAQKKVEEQQCVLMAAQKLQEFLEPLLTEIRRNYSAADFNARTGFVETFFRATRRDVTHEDIRATIISGPGWNPVRLIIGVAVMIKTDGRVHFHGLYYLGRTRALGGHLDHWQSEQDAACGSIELEAGLSELAKDVTESFPTWLRKLHDALAEELQTEKS
jgi:hypothetical protein